jgi:hypothetical protein
MEEDVVVVIVVTAMLIIHQQFVNQRHENSNELKGVVAVAIVVAVEIMVAVEIVVAVATIFSKRIKPLYFVFKKHARS